MCLDGISSVDLNTSLPHFHSQTPWVQPETIHLDTQIYKQRHTHTHTHTRTHTPTLSLSLSHSHTHNDEGRFLKKDKVPKKRGRVPWKYVTVCHFPYLTIIIGLWISYDVEVMAQFQWPQRAVWGTVSKLHLARLGTDRSRGASEVETDCSGGTRWARGQVPDQPIRTAMRPELAWHGWPTKQCNHEVWVKTCLLASACEIKSSLMICNGRDLNKTGCFLLWRMSSFLYQMREITDRKRLRIFFAFLIIIPGNSFIIFLDDKHQYRLFKDNFNLEIM